LTIVDAATLTVDATGGDVDITIVKSGGGSVSAAFTSGTGTVSGNVATLSGPVVAGGVWTLTLDGKPYSHTATAGDTLLSIARALAAAIDKGLPRDVIYFGVETVNVSLGTG